MAGLNLLCYKRFCWCNKYDFSVRKPSIVLQQLSIFRERFVSALTIEHDTASNEGFSDPCRNGDETVFEKTVSDDVELVITLGVVQWKYPFSGGKPIWRQLHCGNLKKNKQ